MQYTTLLICSKAAEPLSLSPASWSPNLSQSGSIANIANARPSAGPMLLLKEKLLRKDWRRLGSPKMASSYWCQVAEKRSKEILWRDYCSKSYPGIVVLIASKSRMNNNLINDIREDRRYLQLQITKKIAVNDWLNSVTCHNLSGVGGKGWESNYIHNRSDNREVQHFFRRFSVLLTAFYLVLLWNIKATINVFAMCWDDFNKMFPTHLRCLVLLSFLYNVFVRNLLYRPADTWNFCFSLNKEEIVTNGPWKQVKNNNQNNNNKQTNKQTMNTHKKNNVKIRVK